MDLIEIKNKSDLDSDSKFYLKRGGIILSILFLISIFIPVVYSDYIISAADGNVNVHFDTNAGSVPTMNLNINDFNIHNGYVNITASDTISKWLFGFLFVVVFTLVFFMVLFEPSYKNWI